MKQKLLLALFVLFASVGAMRAADGTVTLSLPAYSEDISISVSPATNLKYYVGATGTTEVALSSGKLPSSQGTELTYRIVGEYTSLTISSGTITTVTVDNPNLKSLTVSNPNTGTIAVSSAAELTSLICKNIQLETLTLTSAPKLQTLDCQSNKLSALTLPTTTALTTINCANNGLTSLNLADTKETLTTLDCTNNKLTSITVTSGNKISSLRCGNNVLTGEIANVDKSKVTYDYQIKTSTSATATANALYDIAAINGYGADILYPGKSAKSITWGQSWLKEDANNEWKPNSSDAHKESSGVYPTQFTFYTNGKYTSGNYRFSVSSTESPVKYWVELKVNPASFAFKVGDIAKTTIGTTPTVNGSLTVTGNTSTTVAVQGEKLTFAPTPATGFEFDKYTITPTDELVLSSGQYEVTGKTTTSSISVTPVFKAKKYAVKYVASSANGEYSIRVKGGDALTGGSGTIDYGKYVSITAKPREGYKAVVTINNVAVTALTSDPNVYEEQILGDASISISFDAGSVTKSKITLTTNETTRPFTTAKIGNIDAWSSDMTANTSCAFDPKTSQTISLVTTTSLAKTKMLKELLINGNAIQFTTNIATDGTATYTALFEVPSVVVNMRANFVALSTLTVAPGTNIYVYDGNSKAFAYSTSPSKETLTSIKYAAKASDNSANAANYSGNFTTEAPTGFGFYAVKYSRKADAVYAAIDEKAQNSYDVLNIQKTTVKVAEPTVTIKEVNGIKKYILPTPSITPSSVKGDFEVVSYDNGTTYETVTKNVAVLVNAAHNIKVKFTAKTAAGTADPNYAEIEFVVPVASFDGKDKLDSYKVSIVDIPANSGITIQMKNGGRILDGNSVTVSKGTVLTFVVNNPNDWAIDGSKPFYEKSANNPEVETDAVDNVYTMAKGLDHSMNVVLNATAKNLSNFAANVTAKDVDVDYDGSIKGYDVASNVANIENFFTISSATATVLSYTNAEGTVGVSPVDAGVYTVSIKLTATGYNPKTITGKFVINKKTLKATTDFTWPTSAQPIAKGQKLSQAAFVEGTTNVAGTFTWKTPDVIPTVDKTEYELQFVPEDMNNYVVKTTSTLKVTVSSKLLVTYANTVNGTLNIKDANGVIYISGDVIAKNAKLTITAVPNEGFMIDNLTINEAAFTSGSTLTVTDKSLAIVSTFKLKSANPSALKVTFTKTGKGFTVDKADAIVKFKDNFSFTVKTAAADKDKVVVKGGATVLKANENGTYTLSAMTKDTVISISLATPTKLKVAIEKETKNAKGTKMGKVQIQGVTADSTYYYGDVLTLTAFPESGVSFHSWSDSNTDNPRTYMVTTATALKPSFTGTPTGIDDIEGTKVYGAEGYIYVSCEGQATVTVVAMDGRSQQVRIVGEARIETGAGIYGVILQQGAEVLKTKVVVR